MPSAREDRNGEGRINLTHRLNSIHRTTHLLRHSTIPAAMRLIAEAGLTSRPLIGGIELVADRFELCPAIGFWRSIDGKRVGYSVRTLIAAARA